MTTERAEAQLEIKVQGLKPKDGALGVLRIALFSSSEGFPDDPKKAFLQRSVDLDSLPKHSDPQKQPLSVTEHFLGLQSDQEYAVAVFQDVNRNEKLDKDVFGIPTEGFGFSQNPTIWRGAPAFSKCTINLKKGTNSSIIEIIYLF